MNGIAAETVSCDRRAKEAGIAGFGFFGKRFIWEEQLGGLTTE